MGRCLDHLTLFADDADRERFLSLLAFYLERTDTRCYAWVLMDNHYHLVLRLSDRELYELMKPLNMHYAHYHHKKNGRRGPLFMDRYCGDAASDARKALAYIAAKKFRAPLLAIADYLGVGRTAASAMSRSGREIVKKYSIVI